MRYLLIAWFAWVFGTVLYVANTFECSPMGFSAQTDRSICQSQAMSEAFMAGAFPPVYWAFRLGHRQ